MFATGMPPPRERDRPQRAEAKGGATPGPLPRLRGGRGRQANLATPQDKAAARSVAHLAASTNTLPVESGVDTVPHMQTIQVVVENALLQEADRATRRYKTNRSALIRQALRQYLKQLELRDKERRDRDGYRGRAQSQDGFEAWDEVAAWPED